MKKFIKRLFGIVLGMILCCNNLCYADVISITPMDELGAGSMMLIPVGIIIFLIILVSYISLKITAKKEKTMGKINEVTQKNIEKDKKYLSICVFILTILVSMTVFMLNERYYPWTLIVPIIVLLIITIVFRAKDKKKISYVLYAIAVAIFGVMCIQGNSVKNEANEERRKYIEESKNYEIEVFNSQWEMYCGISKSAFEVRSVFAAIIANNASEKQSGRDRYVNFSGNSSNPNTEALESAPTLTSPDVSVENNLNTYDIIADYGPNGYVVNIRYVIHRDASGT